MILLYIMFKLTYIVQMLTWPVHFFGLLSGQLWIQKKWHDQKIGPDSSLAQPGPTYLLNTSTWYIYGYDMQWYWCTISVNNFCRGNDFGGLAKSIMAFMLQREKLDIVTTVLFLTDIVCKTK